MATDKIQNMYNLIKAAGSAKAFASQAQPTKVQPVTRTIQRQAQSVDSFDSLVRSVKW